MIVRELEVENELGFHARVASRIVRETKRVQSSVVVRKGGERYDLKSIMGVMTVNAKKGDILTVEFCGEDEQDACQGLVELFKEKFGEK